MPERIIFHNPDHVAHKGWTEDSGKTWDVPGRLFPVLDDLLSDDTPRTEWVVVPELRPETLELITRAHSTEMIQAIARASSEATADNPKKTGFDIDTDTDASAIYPGTFEQALMSAECAASAARALVSGETELAITVSRPPGHHAGRNFYHGFCYLNLAAVGAEAIKEQGQRVAILDFDIHHGDGTQDIFYDDPNVMYASLHADPDLVMPGTGHSEETGGDNARNTIVNIPLPIGVDAPTYMRLLDGVNERIRGFAPDIIIVEAGFDGHKHEFIDLPPITQLGDKEYHEIGRKIGALGIPALVIFGGGYNQAITSRAFLSYIQGMEAGRGIRDAAVYTPSDLLVEGVQDS